MGGAWHPSARSRVLDYVPALQVMRDGGPLQQEDSLCCLWAQIRALAGRKWREAVIVRTYDQFQEQFEQALQHNLPAVTIPPYVRTVLPQCSGRRAVLGRVTVPFAGVVGPWPRRAP